MPLATLLLPTFDPPTRYMSSYLKVFTIPKLIRNMRVQALDLFRFFDRRSIFRNTTQRSNLVIGCGHGDTSSVTGQHLEVLWEVGKYDKVECEGKIIKLISCECGTDLGPDLINNGARTFQGYTKIFSFYVDMTLLHLALPWIDFMARKYLIPPVKGINALIDGKTNKEAYEIEYQAWQEMIDAETDPEMKAIMENNQQSLVMLGDPNACL